MGPQGPSGAMQKQVIRSNTYIGTEDAFYLVLGAHEIVLPFSPAPNQLIEFRGNNTGARINFNGNYYMFGEDPGLYWDLNTFAQTDLTRSFILFWADNVWIWMAN